MSLSGFWGNCQDLLERKQWAAQKEYLFYMKLPPEISWTSHTILRAPVLTLTIKHNIVRQKDKHWKKGRTILILLLPSGRRLHQCVFLVINRYELIGLKEKKERYPPMSLILLMTTRHTQPYRRWQHSSKEEKTVHVVGKCCERIFSLCGMLVNVWISSLKWTQVSLSSFPFVSLTCVHFGEEIYGCSAHNQLKTIRNLLMIDTHACSSH